MSMCRDGEGAGRGAGVGSGDAGTGEGTAEGAGSASDRAVGSSRWTVLDNTILRPFGFASAVPGAHSSKFLNSARGDGPHPAPALQSGRKDVFSTRKGQGRRARRRPFRAANPRGRATRR